MLESYKGRGKAFLILEYYSGGDLEQYLRTKQGQKLDEDQALLMFAKICEGYRWFVINGILHRDLKPSNIFIEGDNPAIGDFGSSRDLKFEMSIKGFSFSNLAPEQMTHKTNNYDRKVDIWALGLILYRIVYGKHPFGDDDGVELKRRVEEENPSLSENFKRTNWLLQGMLEKDPNKRISWSQLYGCILSLSNPQKLLEETTVLIDSAKFYSLAVKVFSKCQSLKVQTSRSLFLPHKDFLFLIYGFAKIALLKLRLATQYAEEIKAYRGQELAPEKTLEFNNLKETFENFMKDEDLKSQMELLRSIWENHSEGSLILNPISNGEDPIDVENIFKRLTSHTYQHALKSATDSELELGDYQQLALQVITSMHDMYLDDLDSCKVKKHVTLLQRIALFNDLKL